MRELEASLQQFGEFILKAQLVKEKAAPYCVRWVRRFLTRPASDELLADQVRRFCEDLERNGACQGWQVRQAEHALGIYFVNFPSPYRWHRRPASAVVDENGRTNRWQRSSSFGRVSGPAIIHIEPSAATRIGCVGSSRI
jgi:hypothetical protein